MCGERGERKTTGSKSGFQLYYASRNKVKIRLLIKEWIKEQRSDVRLFKGMKKDEDITLKPVTLNKERRPRENLNMTDQVTGSEPNLFN